MSIDVPLLRKYVEWVEEQETLTENREWFQEYWATNLNVSDLCRHTIAEHFCDTAFCLAGKIATDHGWKPTWNTLGEASHAEMDGVVQGIATVAARLLGIEHHGHGLFRANNKAADIRRIAEELAGERL